MLRCAFGVDLGHDIDDGVVIDESRFSCCMGAIVECVCDSVFPDARESIQK